MNTNKANNDGTINNQPRSTTMNHNDSNAIGTTNTQPRSTTMTRTDIATIRAEIFHDLVDDARYPDFAERVLARIGDDAVTLFDSADELSRRGFDIDALGNLLMHGCINGTEIGNLVEAANNGEATIGDINRQLADRRPFVSARGSVISIEAASAMGIDLDLLTACRGRSLTERSLYTLLSNVKRGKTKADDANTGLAHYADGDVA
jgi:hypothetical protein